MAAYLSALSAGWTQRFALDGIRMDTAKYVLPSYFHVSWVPAVRAVRPLFLVAEVFDETVANLVPYLDAGFDSTFNFPLYGALVSAVGQGQSLDAVATVLTDEQSELGAARARRLVNMVDNHDTQRFANEPGPSVANDEIRARLELALAIAFFAPGIPQLYAGDELGLFGGPNSDNRRDMPAWAWTAAGRATAMPPEALPDAELIYAYVQKLVALRRAHAALADGDYAELWRPNGSTTQNVLAFLRTGGGETLLFAGNGGAQQATVTLMMHGRIADGTTLGNLIGGAPDVTTANGTLAITLPAKSAALYRPRSAGSATRGARGETLADGDAGQRRARAVGEVAVAERARLLQAVAAAGLVAAAGRERGTPPPDLGAVGAVVASALGGVEQRLGLVEALVGDGDDGAAAVDEELAQPIVGIGDRRQIVEAVERLFAAAGERQRVAAQPEPVHEIRRIEPARVDGVEHLDGLVGALGVGQRLRVQQGRVLAARAMHAPVARQEQSGARRDVEAGEHDIVNIARAGI